MIRLTKVSKIYDIGGEDFKALDNISLEIKRGDFTAIQGPSGSGKSTVMHIMGLLDHASSGIVYIDNIDTTKLSDNEISSLRNKFIGFVFQQFNLINKLNILENILLPTIYAHREINYNPKEYALELMHEFGIIDKAKSYPNKLSGGQQQRVAIARSLIMKPELVLADEPTGNLDTKNGDAILDLLLKLNKEEKITIVMITHEEDVARKARKIIRIRDGKMQ